MRPSIWSVVRIDQTCLGRSGGFAPVSFPLFHGLAQVLGPKFTCMAMLLGSVTEGEEHVPLREALELGRFSSQSGLRVRPSSNRPVAVTLRRHSRVPAPGVRGVYLPRRATLEPRSLAYASRSDPRQRYYRHTSDAHGRRYNTPFNAASLTEVRQNGILRLCAKPIRTPLFEPRR